MQYRTEPNSLIPALDLIQYVAVQSQLAITQVFVPHYQGGASHMRTHKNTRLTCSMTLEVTNDTKWNKNTLIAYLFIYRMLLVSREVFT